MREGVYWEPHLSQDRPMTPTQFHDLFQRSVGRRLIADVPVGAALSGGLDSSTIVGLMSDLLRDDFPDAESMRGQVKAFSAVFDGDPIDERAYIEEAIRSSGADTVYTHPDSKTFTEELQDLVYYLDEPFVSTGPYAQWCVMRTAKEHVKVVLDGQGGDELLAGYVPYQLVYLRQLFDERQIGRFLREAWLARGVLWPIIRRNLRNRRRHLPTRPLLREEFLRASHAPQDTRSSSNLKARLLDR
ncbi:asparagine synthase (glutamine-hydrolyzing), partial [mine drainage metagenome]